MIDRSRVLVAEDEGLIRLTMRQALEEDGYTVVEVHDGVAALEQLENIDDLLGLVTDIRMGPGPDGWEVAVRARERFPTLSVVYVTGDSTADWPSKGDPFSVALQKPFVSAELVAALVNQSITRKASN